MDINSINHFNIRVYGLCLNPAKDAVLTSLEHIKGKEYIKFPGGGLEFGEGIADCLRREWREELARELINIEHFYTCDFFLQSAFNPRHQVISIYYLADDDFTARPLPAGSDDPALLGFRFLPMNADLPALLSFPTDRVVAGLLMDKFIGSVPKVMIK